jgi:5-oxoprolinase (ATP-hydrolysing)
VDPSTLTIDVAVDTGGTFTDIVARRSDGATQTLKVPSTPRDPSEAVLNGLAALAKVLPGNVTHVAHGTTVATNGLLEGKGARAVLITNSGFEDLLQLRRQNRPNIYDLFPSPRPPLIPRTQTLGLVGRLRHDGSTHTEQEDLAAFIQTHHELLASAESFAVCLLHSYANPVHEQQVGAALTAAFPGVPLTLSSRISPLSREYERAETTAANAFIAPVMTRYIGKLRADIAPAELSVMDSAGGRLTVQGALKEPVRTALSGPAGGVRGAWAAGCGAGYHSILGLDIGGTSTDVSIAQGHLRPKVDGRVGEIPLRTPMLNIETVGAGGGSIAFIDSGGALCVGPKSAGADPGPAAYGKAGVNAQATVTDANVVLGRIPNLLGGSMAIDHGAAEAAIARVAEKLAATVMDTAKAIVSIAESTMVRACKNICMSQGVDPRELALVAFGGAGGLHGCAVAEQLGCKAVLFPANSGVLSAQGIQNAPIQSSASRSYFVDSRELESGQLCLDLENSLTKLKSECELQGNLQTTIYLDCRLVGQSHDIALRLEEVVQDVKGESLLARARSSDLAAKIRSHFANRHKVLYGWEPEVGDAFELTAFRVHLSQAPHDLAGDSLDSLSKKEHDGPKALSSYSATLWLPSDWEAVEDSSGSMVCTRKTGHRQHRKSTHAKLGLEVHRQRLSSIAEEMGAALMRSSYSANIKERRDFSCALFDGQGNLLIQAAHIPVHLGSQELSVKAAIEHVSFSPGDTVILNDPFCGGTHLPDVTLVSPVFLDDGNSPAFFVANRAHHADVGGISPGSMPAPFFDDGTTRTLEILDEGFCIGPTLLDDGVRDAFVSASRTPAERLGDLRAQEAANHVGIQRLKELAESSFSPEELLALNEALLDYAEARMRAVIGSIPDGSFTFVDALDSDGINDNPISIEVTLTVHGDEAVVDFSNSAPSCDSALNAVKAITLAATYYVFRCLAPEEMPSSGGIMRPLRVITRPGSICDAQYPSAVSAGNVETSQRLVDALLGALYEFVPKLVPAASCGSMNNVLIGGIDSDSETPAWVHYETLAGGCGAGPSSHGASALHSHMTNTLNTPIEEMERLFPVLMPCYRIRETTTGGDTFRGGRGIERQYQFLRHSTLTLMTERRRIAPYGLAGGESGQLGENSLVRATGATTPLPGKVACRASPGDILVVKTPGGGGWGAGDQ